MPKVQPIPAICYSLDSGSDISNQIAPPYDVLDEKSKAALLAKSSENIVAVDLPHLPAKTVGPDETYKKAGELFRDWLSRGVLKKRSKPAMFVYQQTYTVGEKQFKRSGLIANLSVQPFGPSPEGHGGIFPHEQTFGGPKEDRLKLMRATGAQLSPIFGLHSDPEGQRGKLLAEVSTSRKPDFFGATDNDGVLHEVWVVEEPDQVQRIGSAFAGADVFIADGHHRYNTALNYRNELKDAGKDTSKADHCLFVLVAMQDPGMIVLPTHRVLGGMDNFSMQRFVDASRDKLKISAFEGGSLDALEKALPGEGPHAIGLYAPSTGAMAIAKPVDADPLAKRFPNASEAWRHLDVALVQHLIVEDICQPTFCGEGKEVTWKFPHDLEQLKADAHAPGYNLGIVLRSTPLDSVRQVSEAGELMPQKSTFFYPKLATGLVINPVV